MSFDQSALEAKLNIDGNEISIPYFQFQLEEYAKKNNLFYEEALKQVKNNPDQYNIPKISIGSGTSSAEMKETKKIQSNKIDNIKISDLTDKEKQSFLKAIYDTNLHRTHTMLGFIPTSSEDVNSYYKEKSVKTNNGKVKVIWNMQELEEYWKKNDVPLLHRNMFSFETKDFFQTKATEVQNNLDLINNNEEINLYDSSDYAYDIKEKSESGDYGDLVPGELISNSVITSNNDELEVQPPFITNLTSGEQQISSIYINEQASDFTANSTKQKILANRLSSCADDLDAKIQELYGKIDELGGSWQDEAYKAYKTGVDSYKKSIGDLSESIRMYSKKFDDLSGKTEELATNCISEIDSLIPKG